MRPLILFWRYFSSLCIALIILSDACAGASNSSPQWNQIAAAGCDAHVVAVDHQNEKTVYVGTGYKNVYKSADYGVTWSASNIGLTNRHIWCLAIHPLTSNNSYAGTTKGVFKSSDGGVSWSCIGLDQHNETIDALAFSHTHPLRPHAATSSRGIYRIDQP